MSEQWKGAEQNCRIGCMNCLKLKENYGFPKSLRKRKIERIKCSQRIKQLKESALMSESLLLLIVCFIRLHQYRYGVWCEQKKWRVVSHKIHSNNKKEVASEEQKKMERRNTTKMKNYNVFATVHSLRIHSSETVVVSFNFSWKFPISFFVFSAHFLWCENCLRIFSVFRCSVVLLHFAQN